LMNGLEKFINAKCLAFLARHKCRLTQPRSGNA
jgi:hypothetical protein